MRKASANAGRIAEGGIGKTWKPPTLAEVDGTDPVTPPPPRELVVVDAPDQLERDAPAAIVRDRDGLIHLEYPSPSRRSGRARTAVQQVFDLPEVGKALLLALLSRCRDNAPVTWEKYSVALRNGASALAATPYAAVAPVDMPGDLMSHVVVAREKAAGGALMFNGREDMNRFRALMALVPGTDHIDLRRRANAPDVPGQWRMRDGEVEPNPKLAFTDADIEKLAKRCSLEIRATIARRNQLVSYLNGNALAPGPSSPDILLAARVLLDADPVRSTSCAKLFEIPSAVHQLFFRIGWDFIEGLACGVDPDGVLKSPSIKIDKLIGLLREYVQSGRDRDMFGQRHPRKLRGFVRQGWLQAVRVAYPTSRDMCAPASTMGILTRWNSGLLAKMQIQALRPRDLHWTELDADDADADGAGRVQAAPWKPRARRLQPVDFPVTDEPEDPVPLTRFVQDWTFHIRDPQSRFGSDLFLFVNGAPERDTSALSFASGEEKKFREEFAALCMRAGTVVLTPRALRPIGIDIIHDRTNGDQMLVHAAGNWAVGSAMPGLYVAGPAQARDQERLYWAIRLLERQRFHGIAVEHRPRGADLFAVEDGFRCGNPLDPPDPLGPGDLCRSRGICAICPHADIDVVSPIWSVARLVARAVEISRRLQDGATPSWSRRYRPVLHELLEVWLPLFPDDVIAAARRHPDYPCLELPDVDA